jgi:GNAT superfamily N-acetyltransferase
MAQFTIRPAEVPDTEMLARIKGVVWEQEDEDINHIAYALGFTNRVTHIALNDETPAGFVDGFLTISAAGEPRWEVDLLAVHPDYRRQGLAAQLIKANIEAGKEHGATLARGLVAYGNLPAEKSFAQCGFQPDNFISTLYIAYTSQVNTLKARRVGAHFIPVQTFSYRGLWIEDSFNLVDLQFAQSVIDRLSHYGWQLAGAVIPGTQTGAIKNAQQAGYEPIGEYRNWLCKLK